MSFADIPTGIKNRSVGEAKCLVDGVEVDGRGILGHEGDSDTFVKAVEVLKTNAEVLQKNSKEAYSIIGFFKAALIALFTEADTEYKTPRDFTPKHVNKQMEVVYAQLKKSDTSQLDELTKNLNKVQETHKELNKMLTTTQEQLEKKQAELEKKDKDYKELDARNKTAAAQMTEVFVVCDKYQTEKKIASVEGELIQSKLTRFFQWSSEKYDALLAKSKPFAKCINRQEAEIKALKASLKTKDEETEKMNASLKTKDEETEKLNASLNTKNDEIANLTATISRQKTEIQQLHESTNTQQKEHKRLSEMRTHDAVILGEKNICIEKLTAECKTLKEEVEALKTKQVPSADGATDETIEKLQEENQRLQRTLTGIRKELSDVQQLQKETRAGLEVTHSIFQSLGDFVNDVYTITKNGFHLDYTRDDCQQTILDLFDVKRENIKNEVEEKIKEFDIEEEHQFAEILRKIITGIFTDHGGEDDSQASSSGDGGCSQSQKISFDIADTLKGIHASPQKLRDESPLVAKLKGVSDDAESQDIPKFPAHHGKKLRRGRPAGPPRVQDVRSDPDPITVNGPKLVTVPEPITVPDSDDENPPQDEERVSKKQKTAPTQAQAPARAQAPAQVRALVRARAQVDARALINRLSEDDLMSQNTYDPQ